MLRLYWDVGRMIDARQRKEGWGAGVIPRLAANLRNELSEVKGFSERNIKRMLAFYRAYSPSVEFVPQPVAQIADETLLGLPWGHHILLLEKVKDASIRRWYMGQVLAEGWSRNVLGLMIDGRAHERQGKKRGLTPFKINIFTFIFISGAGLGLQPRS